MDHILHVQVEHQSSAKHCDRGVARSAGAGADASRVTLALAAIAFLALFLSSFSMARATSQNSSTLPARLLAVAGSIFTSKTALFVLSNVIFILLAADCRCRFAATASAGDAASSGEPGGVQMMKSSRRSWSWSSGLVKKTAAPWTWRRLLMMSRNRPAKQLKGWTG